MSAQDKALSITRLQAESTLTAAQQATVMQHFAEIGTERLRPIFEALDGQVPYAEIHLLRAVYQLTVLAQTPE